jgi:GH18 family chitinase
MTKNKKIIKPPKSVTLSENDACTLSDECGGNDGNDHTGRFEVKAYWAEWSPYNVGEPTGFPGSTNKTPCDNNSWNDIPPSCPGSTHDKWDLYNENTKNLTNKLEYVDTLVYSFAEIKQNTNPNVVAESGGLMLETATSYTSDPNKAGKLYIFDGWSALKQEDATWFTKNNDLMSDGYIKYLQDSGRDTTNPESIKWDLGYGNLSALRDYETTPLVKILGIGGYGDIYQHGWLAAVNNPKIFADSVNKILTDFKLDGIDIDWEPLSFINNDPILQQPLKNQFIYMTQVLKETLGDDKLIGFPIGVNVKDIEEFGADNWKSLMEYVDEVGLMAYDMHGTFDNPKLTGLHSMTYPIACDATQFSADGAAQKLIEFGVPAEKISVGYPSYGRGLQGVCEGKLGAEFTGPHTKANLDPATGISSYTWLMNKLDTDPNAKEYTVTVDHDGKAVANGAYMYFDNDVFYSYDNVASLTDKAHYVVDNGFRGVLTWIIENDLPVSDDRSLIKVAAKVLHEANNVEPVRYTRFSSDHDIMEMSRNHSHNHHYVEDSALLVA